MFPTPFLLRDRARAKPLQPLEALPGPPEPARFRLAARYFLPLQKVPKNRPGDGRRRTTATKGVAQVLSVLSPSPPFLQESRIKTAPQPIRRWSKPIHFATNCRCRSSGSCRTLSCPQEHACSRQVPGPGALSWAAGGIAPVGVNGNGAGGGEYPSYHSAGP